MSRFRTQSPHTLVGIVAGERSQVHAGNSTQKPRRLPFFLYRAPGYLRLGAPLHGARVDPNLLHPIEIERNPGVGKKRASRERSDGVRAVSFSGSDRSA